MEQISIAFKDAKGSYERKLTTTLFPLIANLLEVCDNGESISIPFEKREFDDLFTQIIHYLRGEGRITLPPKSLLYEFLLCDVYIDVNELDGERPSEEEVALARHNGRGSIESYYALTGNYDLLKLRFAIGGSNVNKNGICQIFADNFEMLKWARSNGCPWDARVFSEAIYSNNLEMIQWMRANDCPYYSTVYEEAAGCGSLEILQWLIRTECALVGSCWLNSRVFTLAARGGYIDILEYLRAIRCPYDEEAYEVAPITVLDWLHAHEYPFNPIVASIAAKNGRLDALKWFCAHGCSADWQIFAAAIEGRHFEILEWLRANELLGESLNKYCAAAAACGNLEVLKWLHSNGCSFNSEVCCMAARNGHIETLQWLRANSCPWDKQECLRAATYHSEICDWIIKQQD